LKSFLLPEFAGHWISTAKAARKTLSTLKSELPEASSQLPEACSLSIIKTLLTTENTKNTEGSQRKKDDFLLYLRRKPAARSQQPEACSLAIIETLLTTENTKNTEVSQRKKG
jgi:uncharacterized protein (DUF2267 family)